MKGRIGIGRRWRWSGWRLWLVLVAGGSLPASSWADDSGNWSTAAGFRPGDIVDSDVVAPFELELLDPTETARARHAATANLPIVFVSDGLDGAATKAAIQSSFDETRDRFVDRVRDQFGRYPIGHREANSSRFRDFRVAFQRDNAGYPVGNLLGLTWALGRDDSRLLEPVLETITAAFDGLLVTDGPLDIPVGEVLVFDPERDPGLNGSRLFEAGRVLKNPRIESADTVGAVIRSELEAGYRPVAAYVGGLVHPNVHWDEGLTDAYREWRSQSIRAVTHFKAGEVILRKGEVVTELALLALREIETIGREPARMGPSGIVASHPGVAIHRSSPLGLGDLELLMLALLTLILIGLVAIVVLVARHHRETVTAFHQNPAGLPELEGAAMATRLAKGLSELWRETSRRGDASGRGNSLVELEAQLREVEPKILARIQAFEVRLARLEGKLARAEPGKDTLLRSRVDEVRDRLQAELARHHIDLN